jgi:hypothetical protein
VEGRVVGVIADAALEARRGTVLSRQIVDVATCRHG